MDQRVGTLVLSASGLGAEQYNAGTHPTDQPCSVGLLRIQYSLYRRISDRRCACRGWPPRTPPLPLLFDYVCSKKWWELRGRAERVEIDIAICDGVPGLAAPNPALPISTKTARGVHRSRLQVTKAAPNPRNIGPCLCSTYKFGMKEVQ